MSNQGIIRNRNKISATIYNAQEFERLALEYGSFGKWLDGLEKKNNYSEVARLLTSRFKHVGEGTARIFLYSVGEDIHHLP